jgi:uncharacterized protein
MPDIPTLKESKVLLEHYIQDSNILYHSEATQRKAVQIAQLIASKVSVDIQLVEIGALLHDIGRARTHEITHGYVGGQILQQHSYPVTLVHIVERHVLGGFTTAEAHMVGLPKRNFVPTSHEEKIVCVADKMGIYEWIEINQPRKWLSKIDTRFTQLQKRYGITEPYQTSMQRARSLTRELVELATEE